MLFWFLPVRQAKRQPRAEPSGLVLSHLLVAAGRVEVRGWIWGREREDLEGKSIA